MKCISLIWNVKRHFFDSMWLSLTVSASCRVYYLKIEQVATDDASERQSSLYRFFFPRIFNIHKQRSAHQNLFRYRQNWGLQRSPQPPYEGKTSWLSSPARILDLSDILLRFWSEYCTSFAGNSFCSTPYSSWGLLERGFPVEVIASIASLLGSHVVSQAQSPTNRNSLIKQLTVNRK